MAADQGVAAGELPRFMLPAVEDVCLPLAFYNTFWSTSLTLSSTPTYPTACRVLPCKL